MINRNLSLFRKKSSGSALIMTMIMMVNAVLIMSAATAISYRENKSSGITKISTIALQGADSGLEWALEKKRRGNDTDSISSVFGGYQDSYLEKENFISYSNSNYTLNVRFYFLGSDNEPLTSNSSLSSVYFIRSIATVSAGDDIDDIKVSRALEATVKQN